MVFLSGAPQRQNQFQRALVPRHALGRGERLKIIQQVRVQIRMGDR